jgi:hypothetical protein
MDGSATSAAPSPTATSSSATTPMVVPMLAHGHSPLVARLTFKIVSDSATAVPGLEVLWRIMVKHDVMFVVSATLRD